MSEPKCACRIWLYNKSLYDFLYKYALIGAFQKNKLEITSGSPTNPYPKENLSTICEKERDADYGLYIIDPFGGGVYDIPEGIYDVIPCFLIYIASMFRWEQDLFLDFKTSILREKAEIQMHFDKVSWEAEWIDNRYSWDGIYKWEEKFIYDRFSDKSEHCKKIYKLGLDLEAQLADDTRDEYEIQGCKNAIIERSKYHDYNWDELG